MKFWLFYEISVPRPRTGESERTVYQNALEQVRLADELGFDYVWAVEHHFLEPLRLTNPISASLTTCDTDLPRIRFIMDPEIPVVKGTRRIR